WIRSGCGACFAARASQHEIRIFTQRAPGRLVQSRNTPPVFARLWVILSGPANLHWNLRGLPSVGNFYLDPFRLNHDEAQNRNPAGAAPRRARAGDTLPTHVVA